MVTKVLQVTMKITRIFLQKISLCKDCPRTLIDAWKHIMGCKQDIMSQHITLENDYMSFSQNFGTMFLQLIIINAYSCPCTWHVFSSSFLNKYEFLKMSWFLVNSVFCL
jgi:hypothetical protein